MAKSATDVMQEILVSAVLDAVAALRDASKGVPNTMLRDLSAMHANSTFADFPPELQAAIAGNVRAAFSRLLREGYAVAPSNGQPPRPPAPRRDGPPGGRPGPRPGARPPARHGDAEGRRPPRGGTPRPGGGKPKPPSK